MTFVLMKMALLAGMAMASLLFGILPLKIYSWIERQRSRSSTTSKFARLPSMLSCLSGGVFLGVCLLDLLPISNEAFRVVKQQYAWKTNYPITELLVGSGFFLVYAVEVLSSRICGHNHAAFENKRPDCKHCKDEDDMNEQWSGNEQKEIGTEKDMAEEESSNDPATDNYVKSITLVVAFALHSCLEGFAFSIQSKMLSVVTLFFGIIVHKSVVAFSIGMSLIRSHPNKKYFVLFLITLLAFTAPIGGLIGIAFESSQIGDQSRSIVTAVITSIANGTFLYVTFFEILMVEEGCKEASDIQRWLSTVSGFIAVSMLMFFDP